MKSMNLFGSNDKSREALFRNNTPKENNTPKKKTYTEDFKKKAINLASKIGVTKAAEELGVSTSSIYSWKKTLAKSSTPIQDEDGNLIFILEGKTYSLNVNSEKERERVNSEVNANSLVKYDWFKEETGEKHWVLYNTEMYEVSCDIWRKHFLHYKENCSLNPVIPINATSCHFIFKECKSLSQLDLSNFDTSKVVVMNHMFSNCLKLTALDLSNFDTSKVTGMSSMFSCCKNLIALNISNFNTSKVIDMYCMFYSCESLTQLNLSSFDTSKVTGMYQMFNWCRSLTQLNLSNFDTNQVTDMSWMFSDCKSLTKLDLSSFNASKVTDIEKMFAYCEKLTTIKISNQWNTDSVKFSINMFEECCSLPNFSKEKTDIEMAKPIEHGGYLTLKK